VVLGILEDLVALLPLAILEGRGCIQKGEGPLIKEVVEKPDAFLNN